MSQKITHDQKETALETIREKGTMKAGAETAGVSVRTLFAEMKRSEVFKRRVFEARSEGYSKLADSARQLLIDYMSGKYDKTDRNRLTAAIALLNAYEPGFRGTTTIQGKVEHDVRVITAVPRPKYIEVESPKVKSLPAKTKTIENIINGVAVEVESNG